MKNITAARSAISLACLQGACALALASLTSTSLAQSASQEPMAAGEIIVTASRTEQRVQDALHATTLITRTDIERSAVSDLPTLLRNIAGVEISQSGGRGTLADVRIRGAESRHTLVLIDGVPVNNLNFGTSSIEHIPLADIERVEVVRGNVSSLYGSAAVGGVIQIFTKNNTKASTTAIGLQTGSRGYRSLSASTGQKIGASTQINASIEDTSDKGINAIDQSKRSGTNPDIDGYKRRAYNARLKHSFDAGSIGVRVRDTKTIANYDSEYGPAAQTDIANFESKAAAVDFQLKPTKSLSITGAASSSVERLNAVETAYPYYVTSKNQVSQLSFVLKTVEGQRLNVGLENTTQSIDSDTVYDSSVRKINALRTSYHIDHAQYQLQVGLRKDSYSDFGTANTWLVGGGYRFNQQIKAYLNASTGFNAPTFNDLYYPYGSGNVNLRPERSRSNELGLHFVNQQHDMRLVRFDNQYKDLIADNSAWQRVNVNAARNTGYEWSHSSEFGAHTLITGYTKQTPKDLTTGQTLVRRANNILNVGFSSRVGLGDFSLRYKAVGEQQDAISGVRKVMSAYSLLDATVSHPINTQLRLNARVDNVLNRSYETIYGYNQPKRSLFVGLNWAI